MQEQLLWRYALTPIQPSSVEGEGSDPAPPLDREDTRGVNIARTSFSEKEKKGA